MGFADPSLGFNKVSLLKKFPTRINALDQGRQEST
jgi:hypothetical protein